MKDNHSQSIVQVIREMTLRNFSIRTINAYNTLLNKVEHVCSKPIESIALDQFKSYLHHRIAHDNVKGFICHSFSPSNKNA